MFMLAAAAVVAAIHPPACQARHLSVSLDGRDGDFNGMSHSGTLVVLRNRGAACRIEALPRIAFADVGGRPLPIVRNVPPGMHPGPVMIPITLPAHGIVSTPIRWVLGDVFDHSRCLSPTRISIAIGTSGLKARFSGRICGPADKPAGFDQPPLRPGKDTSAPS